MIRLLIRLALIVMAPILLVTGCGIPEDAAVRPIDNDALPEGLRPFEPVPTTTEAPNPGFPVSIFFFREDEDGGDPELVARTRLVPQPSVEAALQALLSADPTEEEEALGLRSLFGSALPEDDPIELIGTSVNRSRALIRIDLSRVPAITGAASPVPWAQLVFTATQQFREGIEFERVRFVVEDVPVPVQIQAGESEAGRPVFRADYSRYDPEVVDG